MLRELGRRDLDSDRFRDRPGSADRLAAFPSLARRHGTPAIPFITLVFMATYAGGFLLSQSGTKHDLRGSR
jgi:hypothetical protein